MRVANIVEEARFGGPQARIARVAKALEGRVHTTIIMPEENSAMFREQCEKLSVTYKTISISRITKEWRVAIRYVLFSSLEVVRLASLLKLGDYDLVHASGGSWQYKGVIAGKLAGKKVVWHLNDTFMPWALRQLFGLLSPLADGYIFSGERTRQYYGPICRNRKPQFVIPAPVDTAHFDRRKQYDGDSILIEQWRGKTVIGTVANINPVKGIEVFVRCGAALNKKFHEAVFVVVGSVHENQRQYFDNLQKVCRDLAVENILFVGGRNDVRSLLQRFDVFVCSSRFESSPLTVWEAMAMGKPVVSTDVGDVPRYVRNGESGFIVEVGDVERMAQSISILIEDSELRKSFGERAREIAVRELDLSLCAQRHLAAYTHILQAR